MFHCVYNIMPFVCLCAYIVGRLNYAVDNQLVWNRDAILAPTQCGYHLNVVLSRFHVSHEGDIVEWNSATGDVGIGPGTEGRLRKGEVDIGSSIRHVKVQHSNIAIIL